MSATKKRNFYNVSKDGVLIMTIVTNQDASLASGCDPNQISAYASNKMIYHGKDGTYRFEIVMTIGNETKPVKEYSPTVDIKNTKVPPDFEERWDNARFILNPEAVR